LGAAVIVDCRDVVGAVARRAEPRAASPPGPAKALILAIGIALVVAALAAGWANRNILPRLYHWFHLSLTLVSLLACVLAVRLLLAMGRRLLGKRWSWILAVIAVVGLVAGGLCERRMLSRSQGLRYFVYEKTQLASLFVRLCPRPSRGRGWRPPPAAEVLPPLAGVPIARARTSSSSPSTPCGRTTWAATATRAPPRRTSTPLPRAGCASSTPTRKRRTPRSRWPR
jgi:hypothetical protein